jgi:hypothetical protein
MEDNRSAWKSDLLALLRQSGYVVVLETGGNIIMVHEGIDRPAKNGAAS